jgi:hypothetical protein
MEGGRVFSRRKVLGRALFGCTVAMMPGTLRANSGRVGNAVDRSDMVSRIERYFVEWDAIGEHRTGTESDRQTALWLARHVEQFGGAAILQGFPFVRREFTSAFLELDGVRIEGLPCFDALPQAASVRGVLGELNSAAPLGVCEFLPNAPSPHNKPLYESRRAGNHLGIIAIAHGGNVRPGLAVVNAESFSDPYGSPVLQVGTEHRTLIQAAVARRAQGQLVIDETQHTTQAYNVLVEVPGRAPDAAPVLVMTPRSGWWHSTSERGGGIAAWLEAVRSLVAKPAYRTVMFTANTGHELGHVGMLAFQSKYPGMEKSAHCWVHLGANFAAEGGEIRYQASDSGLMQLGLEYLDQEGLEPGMVTAVDTRPFGEARDIYDAGGRYVSLLGNNPLFHHPDDRWPDAVDLTKTVKATTAMVALIRGLADQKV